MPFTDHAAAHRLRDLREDQGLTVEGLAKAIRRHASQQGWIKVHGAVDAYTLRRIEDHGHKPSPRVRLVIALYFGVSHRDIWQPGAARPIDRRTAA